MDFVNRGILKEVNQGGETLDNGEFWQYRSIIIIDQYGVNHDKAELKIEDPKGNLLVSLVMDWVSMGELFTRHRSAGKLWIREYPFGKEF